LPPRRRTGRPRARQPDGLRLPALGHRSARGNTGLVRAIALAAEALAIFATVLGCLALTACATIIAAR